MIEDSNNGDGEKAGPRSYWFVGAAYGGTNDQTDRFLNEGIWENGYKDKHLELVKSIQPGDRIAIKSSYTRKKSLPFDNRGNSVSVMGIKAIGTVTKNRGDGRIVEVDWEPRFDEIREWYFFTNRSTIWRVLPGEWMQDALIDFSFNGKRQDIQRFSNEPYWRERFGDEPAEQHRFKWAQFYEAVADSLIAYKEDRTELIASIHTIASRVDGLSNLQDHFKDGTSGPLKDICPFTAIGIFNRGITEENRKIIARQLAQFLGVDVPVPDSFEGIPILNNQKSWFFGFDNKRAADDIDTLWDIFEKAIQYADSTESDTRQEFSSAYDDAASRYGVGWNLSIGLYWIRPWSYLTLDSQSQEYITKKLGVEIKLNGPKGRCSAADYLEVLETLEQRFKEDAYPVHSFPELSFIAWKTPSAEADDSKGHWKKTVLSKIILLCEEKGTAEYTRQEFQERYLEDLKQEFPDNNTTQSTIDRVMQLLRDDDLIEFVSRGVYRWTGFNDATLDLNVVIEPEDAAITPPIEPYALDDIVDDGCFLDRDTLSQILERLRGKKNLILQGPPGTGKTWLAKRLAYALIGQRNDRKVRPLQFHPNLSYEDFVRGWRPSGDGKLTLVDGPFLEMIRDASKDPSTKYVVVIEEINRGNPAQIFGEMLTLLEADKRTPSEALALCYRKFEDEQVSIPNNLYVIGTMNLADRSLALVDLALRRRFAFINLEPTFGKVWRNWVNKKAGIGIDFLEDIERRLVALNNDISADRSLGPQFKVGHSFVTPAFNISIDNAQEWFRQVVATEIGPLLEEYWFDDLEKASKACDRLLEGL